MNIDNAPRLREITLRVIVAAPLFPLGVWEWVVLTRRLENE
jgi:hypothetical protein